MKNIFRKNYDSNYYVSDMAPSSETFQSSQLNFVYDQENNFYLQIFASIFFSLPNNKRNLWKLNIILFDRRKLRWIFFYFNMKVFISFYWLFKLNRSIEIFDGIMDALLCSFQVSCIVKENCVFWANNLCQFYIIERSKLTWKEIFSK